jgi:hypothetical protein
MTRQSAMNCSTTRQRINVWLVSRLALGMIMPQAKQKHRHDRRERERDGVGDKCDRVNSRRGLRNRLRQLAIIKIELDDDESDNATRKPERENIAYVVSSDACSRLISGDNDRHVILFLDHDGDAPLLMPMFA